ncbi:hypothetical protein, partial [Escherichia coli]|uniref:hypothetical protein n=1 Tax=Escherichia coli TaxID=562 RepID=UPI00123A055A
GVAGPAFQVIKDSLTLGLNALTLTDVTKNAAYGVEIESLVLEINAQTAMMPVNILSICGLFQLQMLY